MSSPDPDSVATLEGVTQRFGGFEALHDVYLHVRKGDVYGLLGLNGAGKTTALRVLLGFLLPQSGRVRLFGQDRARDWLAVAPRLGATIEAPAFYPHLDGRTNLRLLHRLAGSPAGRTPDQALELVGLSQSGGVRARNYSQGMLQRLYIAQALLGSPELLVLDEPTSNLDPRGILEVRRLITRLRDEEGLTVILSSHQLSEVEDVCNRVAILHRGHRLEEAEVETLFGLDQRWIEIELDRPDKAVECLSKQSWCHDVARLAAPSAERRGGSPSPAAPEAGAAVGRVRVRAAHERRAELNALLVHEGFAVAELVERRPSLEDYFHRVTADA